MPQLRALSPHGGVTPLTSATVLIGSEPGKCDVVLAGLQGIHALLTLPGGDAPPSTTSAAAVLVPFGSANDSACFVNGRVVPRGGLPVVPGDRLAFGDPCNALIFEEAASDGDARGSGNSNNNSSSRSQSKVTDDSTKHKPPRQSFRRALDALRGDTVSQPPPSLRATQLKAFLAEASTDSLLGEYVDRKLRSRRPSISSSTGGGGRGGGDESSPRRSLDRDRAAGRRRITPSAMEPPPSLSASGSSLSGASSFQSSRKGSITHTPQQIESASAALVAPSPSLSTVERNRTEMERLRLSQRLRQVNDVLNGHLDIDSSYLSSVRGRAGSRARSRVPSVLSSGRNSVTSAVGKPRLGSGDDDNTLTPEPPAEEEEEEEEEELPTTVERVKPAQRGAQPPPPQDLQQQSIYAIARTSAAMSVRSTSSQQSNESEASLPLLSEPPRPSPPGVTTASSPTHTPSPPPTNTNANSNAYALADRHDQPPRMRTQLHQQLIDRALHQRRLDQQSEAFTHWRRGLRVQRQRRRVKAEQRQRLHALLTRVRRDQFFHRWQVWTQRKAQVVECRESAFQQRCAWRLLTRAWTHWRHSSGHYRQLTKLADHLMLGHARAGLTARLQHWRRQTISERMGRLGKQREQAIEKEAARSKAFANTAALLAYECNVRQRIRHVLQTWRSGVTRERRRRVCLGRVLRGLTRKCQWQCWTTWRLHVRLAAVRASKQQEIQRVMDTMMHERVDRGREQEERHLKELRDLQTTLTQQQEQYELQTRELEKREHQLMTLDRELKNRDQKLTELDDELKKRDQQLTECKSETKKREHRLTELEQELESRNQKVAQLDHELANRDHKLTEYEYESKNRERELMDLNGKLNKKEGESKQRLLEDKVSKDQQHERDERTRQATADAVDHFLERVVGQLEDEVASTSGTVEELLRAMDTDPGAGRWQAASRLVDAMLLQKVRHSDARVALQRELMRLGITSLAAAPYDATHSRRNSQIQDMDAERASLSLSFWKPRLPTAHARFLLDMVQQRLTRLHQLQQAIARLAATISGTIDSEKLRHAAFLADAMHERALAHVAASIASHFHDQQESLPIELAARRY